MDASVKSKLTRFFDSYPLRSYPKNHILLFPHDKAESVYYLVSGRVAQYDISYRGDEVIINTFKPPAFFPMAVAMNKVPNNFFYKTEAVTDLRLAPSEEVIIFLKQNPEVMFDLLGRVYGGIEAVLGRLMHLMSGTAQSRLVYELLTEYRRFGKMENGRRCILVSEVSIGARTGLSRETVNRELRLLKEKGIIAVEAHHIWIDDLEALEGFLGATQ